MSELFTRLAWLPPAQRFNDELKGLRSGAGPFGAELRRIATQGLSLAQLQRLGTVMEALVAGERGCAPLLPLRLGVLGDGTLNFLGQILPPTGARHSLLLDCICAPYGQAIQTALDPHSALHAADCDVVLVALDYRISCRLVGARERYFHERPVISPRGKVSCFARFLGCVRHDRIPILEFCSPLLI